MQIIKKWDNPNGFSWLTIELDQETSKYYLFINNTKGVHREYTHSKNLEWIQSRLKKHSESALRINEVMRGVIANLENDPLHELGMMISPVKHSAIHIIPEG